MTRALKITALVLGAVLLLVALLLGWIIGTESGTRFAVARAQGFLPAGITLGTPGGRLADELVFTDVSVSMEGLDLDIARVWLHWSPTELLGGHLAIAELGAEGIRYLARPGPEPPQPSEPFTLPQRLELPVSVAVDRLILDDATVRTAPEATPLEGNVVTATGLRFADARLELESLEVDSPLLSARGRLTATAAGDYPLDVMLQWRLSPPDYAPLDGTTSLGGSLAALEVEQRLGSPYDTALTGTVTHLIATDQPMSLALALEVDGVTLSRVQAGLPQATVSVTASANGPISGLDVEAGVDGTDPQGRRFVADVAARVAEEAVQIRTLTIRQPGREGELDGQGTIALGQAVSADLKVGWQSLSWPLTGEPTLQSPRGTLQFQGPVDDYRLSLDTRLESAGAPPVDLRIAGTGSTTSAALTLDADVGEGSVGGRVNATWDPAVRGDVELTMAGFDPAVLASDWAGSVNLSLTAAADMQDDQLTVKVSRLDASGRLRDQPLSAAVRGTFVQGDPWPMVEIDTLDASLGSTRLHAQGRVAERADVSWKVASDDLAALVPEAAGSLSGSGALRGTLPQVAVQATLQAADLAYGDNRLASLDLEADIDLSGEQASRLDLTAGDADLAGTAVRRIAVEGAGRPGDHRLRAMVDAEPGGATLALAGRLEDPWGDTPTWHYQLSEGELEWQGLAPWQLSRSDGGIVAAQRLDVGEQCWRSADASVCLQASRDADGLAGSLNLENLQFAYFAAFLPEGMGAEGAINGAAQLSQPEGGVLAASASFETTAGQITLPPADAAAAEADDEGPESVIIRFEPSSITADLDESQARARASLNLEHARLQLQAATSATVVAGTGGTTTPRPVADQELSGNVQIDVPDLAFLMGLMPTLEGVEGRITGDLDVAGTLGEPLLDGALELNGGRVEVPQVGITLAEISATLEGRGRDVALVASASSGGGNVSLDGRLSLPGDAPTASLTIIGREFEVVDNDDATVLLSPDLEVEATAERITVTGAVHVPEADITPGTQAPSAVTVSEDQVLVNEETGEEEAVTERELHAQVRLTLGDAVRFEGFGLTARFEGDVLVNQEPETPTTATGELRIVDGEYQAYGQGLVIDSGRIFFAGGPVTQPALDVRAVRRPAEGILVGAQVGGTLQSPSFELFSEPSMTQQEQLSWLVLGRSMDETPDGQESALSRAALAMGLKGGDFLARNIGEQVGLDQIGIETGSGEAGSASDPSQASLVVGKYLSPKLYVSYGIGLFNPESVLEMQYEISRRWKLVTQSSGESTGADVLYTVELGGN